MLFHPDLSFYSNFFEISQCAGKYLDKIYGLEWYSSTPFFFSWKWSMERRGYEFTWEIFFHDGKDPTEARKRLHSMITLEPAVLECCPNCRTTKIMEPAGPERYGPPCKKCNSRVFYIFVTSREDARRFCEWKNYKVPPVGGALK